MIAAAPPASSRTCLPPGPRPRPEALTSCPLCGGAVRPHARIDARRVDEVFLTEQLRALVPHFTFVRCVHCASLWADDARRAPGLLDALYADLPPEYWGPLVATDAYFGWIESLLRRYARGPYVWDVGCGDGKLLSALSARWRCAGLEPGRSAVQRCREAGLDVRAGSATTAGLRECADAVLCFDVIEHVADPLGELAAMAGMLRPDGVLIVLTGDAAAWTARLAGPVWEYLHCAGHVSILSRPALVRCAASLGLVVEAAETVDHPYSKALAAWLPDVLRARWRRFRTGLYPRLRYCRDHQVLVARRALAAETSS